MRTTLSMQTFRALAVATLLTPAYLAAQTQLTGAGATFPNPMYSKWFDEYRKVHPDVQINYQAIGSGGGIRQVIAGTVDFGATDGPMTDAQLDEFKTKRGGEVLHFPTVLGAVVPVYNIPGLTAPAQVHGRGARRHIRRRDHQVERSGNCQVQSWREAPGCGYRRRASV